MNHYGIDLHSNNFYVSQLDQNDKFNSFKFTLDPKGISMFKGLLAPDDVVAFEASTNSFYFHDQIAPHVGACSVINPKRFKVIYESVSKTDKKDAKVIAQFLKKGLIPEVYVPRKAVRELRSLFSSYLLFNRIIVMAKNRIYSLLKQGGINLKRKVIFSENREVIMNLPLSRSVLAQIELFYQQIDQAEKQKKSVKELIYLQGKEFREEIEILTSQPGISVLIALGVIADVAEIKRFANFKKFVSYLGAAPKVDSSNRTTHIKGIHHDSRNLALTMMTQCIDHFKRSSPHLMKFYEKKTKGKSKGKVRIAIIRKVMVAMYWMLKNKEYSYYRNIPNHKTKIKLYEKTLEVLEKKYS